MESIDMKKIKKICNIPMYIGISSFVVSSRAKLDWYTLLCDQDGQFSSSIKHLV